MPIKCKPTYTEHEVSRIVKDSENQGTGYSKDKAEGHSEGFHELRALGKKRRSTTEDAVETRIFGPEKKAGSGAFRGCQAAAIAFALNRKAGQTALGWLARKGVQYVFVQIDISLGDFPALILHKDDVTPVPGVDFVVHPCGLAATGFLNRRTRANGIAMKLMKTVDGDLHIRTAFPLADAPKPQTCQIGTEGWTWSCDQELPVG